MNERVTLRGGMTINAHRWDMCAGYWCTIHYPSPHHMRDWDQRWLPEYRSMARVCKHGVLHPDPDDFFPNSNVEFYHNAKKCDGCCERPFDLERELR